MLHYIKVNVCSSLFRWNFSQRIHLLFTEEERQEELFIVVRLLLKRVKIVAPLYYTFYHMLWTIAKVQVDVWSVNMNKWVKCINNDFEQTLCSTKYQAITLTRLGSNPFPSVHTL